jgi:D-mannonate dehydratase
MRRLIVSTDEYVEHYILMNGYEEVAGEMYECPGGHLWHYSDIEELVNDMSIAELEELEADWILQNN